MITMISRNTSGELAQYKYESYLRHRRSTLIDPLGVIGVAAFGIGIAPEPATPRGIEAISQPSAPEIQQTFSRDISDLAMRRVATLPRGTIESYALAA